MPKRKIKPSFLLTIAVAAFLIGSGLAAYLVLVERNTFTGNAPVGAALIPQDALVAASISTDQEQWQKLQEYGTAEGQAALAKQLQQLNDNLLTTNGYSYQQDIQPWVGKEVMIAYLSSQTPVSTPEPTPSPSAAALPTQQSVVMVLPIQNPIQAQQLLEKAKSGKSKLVERVYKDVQIRETQSASSQISTTVLSNFLVVSTTPKSIERVIDTYKAPATSLATTPGYSEALAQVKALHPFAKMYFNVPVAAGVAAANSLRSLSPQNLAQLQQKQGVATVVTLEPEGIRFRGISWLKPNSEQKYVVENNNKSMPNRLPSDTLMMMSGGNLQRLWQEYVQGAQGNPILPMSPENLRQGLRSSTGLDLDRDLLPWMQGEFSLSLIPTPQGTPSNLGAGVAFMVQASDRPRAEQALQQLDDFIAKQYKFQVQETQVQGQSVITWTSELGGLTATRGWLDGNVAFLTLGASVSSTFIPKPKTTLAQNQLFQQSVPTDLNPNNGNFFLDVDHTINAGNLALPQLPPNSKIFTNGIRAIGVTGGISDERTSRFDIFVLLKKVEQPGSLPSSNPGASTSPSLKATPPTSGTLAPKGQASTPHRAKTSVPSP